MGVAEETLIAMQAALDAKDGIIAAQAIALAGQQKAREIAKVEGRRKERRKGRYFTQVKRQPLAAVLSELDDSAKALLVTMAAYLDYDSYVVDGRQKVNQQGLMALMGWG